MAAASCELTCMSGKVLLSFPSNPGRDRSRLRPLCYHLFPRRPSLPGVSVLHTPTAAVVFRLMATSGGICREGRGEQRDNACDLLQGQEFVEAVSQPQECLLDVSSRDDATLCQVAGRCGVRSRKIPVRGSAVQEVGPDSTWTWEATGHLQCLLHAAVACGMLQALENVSAGHRQADISSPGLELFIRDVPSLSDRD